MNWGIVVRKLWRGTLVAGGLGILAYLMVQADVLTKDPRAAAWVALAAPLALHYLGVLQNILKHWGEVPAPTPLP